MSRARRLPNAENASAADIQAAIRSGVSERSASRLRAIKALILGATFEFVCALFSIDERTLRRWIVAFNAQGIDGLVDRRHPGRPRAIAREQAEYFEKVIEDPSLAQRTHWSAVRFHGWLRENLDVEVSYRTVVRLFHERGFALKVPRPWPDRQDAQKRELFREQMSIFIDNPDVEIWFQDEMGVEGDPKPRRRWAMKGGKPIVTHNNEHLRMNACGMVCPRTGEAFLLEFSHSDREVFQVFLDKANEAIKPVRARQLLIMDNASWHKAKSLSWGRFEPVYLPPYSPDMNPIERLWLVIKQEWFTDFATRTRQGLIERLDKALSWAMERQSLNRQTCAIRTFI